MHCLKTTGITVILIVLLSFKPKTCVEPQVSSSHKHTYMAMGDSYTIGEGVDETERWPVLLENALRNHSLHINYPYFVASNGWTTAQLLKRLEEEEFSKHYDLISIQIGVNDEFQRHSVSQYTTDFRNLLKKAILLSGNRPGRVFVLSIPDWSVTPFAIKKYNAQLEEGKTALAELEANLGKFNAVCKKETIAAGCHFVDITDISRKAATDPTLICPDGLHPSGKMYKLWVERMYPTVIKALESHRH